MLVVCLGNVKKRDTHSPHSTAPSLMAVSSTPCDWWLCAPHKVHLITRQEHIRAGHI